MDDSRDSAVATTGVEAVNAIYAAYDVICSPAGASNGSGAEQDRIN